MAGPRLRFPKQLAMRHYKRCSGGKPSQREGVPALILSPTDTATAQRCVLCCVRVDVSRCVDACDVDVTQSQGALWWQSKAQGEGWAPALIFSSSDTVTAAWSP
jgi:hypothetical protein